MKPNRSISWWGPPRKFTTELVERKVSWLELFYDLVYVIAVSRVNHHLLEHQDFNGFLDYVYMFTMVYWGWINGSLYHDLHGTPGIRTSLMTLWQMLIVAGLIVTINSSEENLVYNATIAVMVMQLYITYMWWSVGIYDKIHRELNRPYTWIYLISFATLFLTFFVEAPFTRVLFYISLILNFIPPIATMVIRWQESQEFKLSSSMTERMGLFTIIVFGEVILGVVNGASSLHHLNLSLWLQFGLAIGIVFSLWWLFFGLISDRSCKKGMFFSFLTELIYIPTLMGLGLTGLAFDGLFEYFQHPQALHSISFPTGFILAICLFLLGILLMLFLLNYPPAYAAFKARTQLLIGTTIIVLFAMSLFLPSLALTPFLGIILLILIMLILALAWSSLSITSNE